ncbi:hypothetical protein ACFFRR_004184 [Megaselia abdita]
MEFRKFAIFLVFIVCVNAQNQNPNVNPKLDFDGDNENSTDGRQYHGGSSPKIHGVRVSLDTGDGSKKVSRESKESVEHTDGKGKKRVGIHTDITFEITGAGVAVTKNHTRNIEGEDEDASVPTFRGKGRSTYRPRGKPFDPKTYYNNPNYSSERRSFTSEGGSSGRRGYSNGGRTADEERSYYEPYRPASQTYDDELRWKPCYCVSSSQDRRRRSGGDTVKATSSVIQVVDDKLDGPFQRNQRRFREEV